MDDRDCYELAVAGFILFSINWFGGDPQGYLGTIAQIEFTFSFVGKRVTRPWRFYEGLLLAVLVTLQVPAWHGFISRGLINLAEVALLLPGSFCMLVLLLIWYRRGHRETGWLILPSILPMLGVLVTDLGIASSYLEWNRVAQVDAPVHVGVFTLELFSIANLLFLLAIGVVMFFRFTRVSREQARSAAELEAAQRVQALLLRARPAGGTSLKIESVYQPAQEVGGDFFHTYGGALSVSAGGIEPVEAAAGAARDRRIFVYLPTALFNIALVLAGIGALIPFAAQRSRTEYLWLGLYFTVLGTLTVIWRAVDTGLLPYWTNSLFADPLTYLVEAFQIEFSFAFINRRVSRGWRVCQALLLTAMVLAFLTSAGLFLPSAYWLIEALVSLIVAMGLPILLLVQFRRGNREAGLLILPSLLPAAAQALGDIGTAAVPLGLPGPASLAELSLSLSGVRILVVDLSDIGFLLAIGALLVFRFTRTVANTLAIVE